MATVHEVPGITHKPLRLPQRRPLNPGAPTKWLEEATRYWLANPLASLSYGLIFAAAGVLITWLGANRPQSVLALWSGFLLVGPILAMGLYRIARQTDQGRPLSFMDCLRQMNRQRGLVAFFSLMLGLIMIGWIHVSSLAITAYIGHFATLSTALEFLRTPEGFHFFATLAGICALFSAFMFLLTAWSMPMVADGKADVLTAIVSSIYAVVEQPVSMLGWAALVAGLTLIGMATFFLAFVVIFPLLGYATWAGYKELFDNE